MVLNYILVGCPWRVCIRSINQSNRSLSVRLLFLFCLRVFNTGSTGSYENRCNKTDNGQNPELYWGDRGHSPSRLQSRPPQIVPRWVLNQTSWRAPQQRSWQLIFVILEICKRNDDLRLYWVRVTRSNEIKNKKQSWKQRRKQVRDNSRFDVFFQGISQASLWLRPEVQIKRQRRIKLRRHELLPNPSTETYKPPGTNSTRSSGRARASNGSNEMPKDWKKNQAPSLRKASFKPLFNKLMGLTLPSPFFFAFL